MLIREEGKEGKEGWSWSCTKCLKRTIQQSFFSSILPAPRSPLPLPQREPRPADQQTSRPASDSVHSHSHSPLGSFQLLHEGSLEGLSHLGVFRTNGDSEASPRHIGLETHHCSHCNGHTVSAHCTSAEAAAACDGVPVRSVELLSEAYV